MYFDPPVGHSISNATSCEMGKHVSFSVVQNLSIDSWNADVSTGKRMGIGRFPRFGDFHISWLRPQNLECHFGLSWFRENGKNAISPQIILIYGN